MKKSMTALFLSLVMLCLCSCGQAQDKGLQSGSEVHIDIGLDSKQDMWICSVSDNKAVISVSQENGKSEGPLSDTQYIAVYDLEKNETVKKYTVDTDAYITSALLYQDGLLYVDYDGTFEDVKWSLIYEDEQGKEVLDSAVVSSYTDTPSLALVGGKAVYVYPNQKRNSFILKCAEEKEVRQLVSMKGYSTDTTQISVGADSFCFTATKKGDTYSTAFFAGTEGIKAQLALNGKITSFTAESKYAIFGLGDEAGEKFSVLTVDMASFETKKTETAFPLYRLAASGESCLCVDNHFQIYSFDTQSGQLQQQEKPQSYYLQNASVIFHSAPDGKFIVRFDSSDAEKPIRFYVY